MRRCAPSASSSTLGTTDPIVELMLGESSCTSTAFKEHGHIRARAVSAQDGTGVFGKSASQGGGFYIDVGAASLIASRKVTLARGAVARIEREGVVLESGQTVAADVIIYCTGFGSMHHFVAGLSGHKTILVCMLGLSFNSILFRPRQNSCKKALRKAVRV